MDQDIFGNIRDSPNVVLDTIVRPPWGSPVIQTCDAEKPLASTLCFYA
jgi:hypothetical protein